MPGIVRGATLPLPRFVCRHPACAASTVASTRWLASGESLDDIALECTYKKSNKHTALLLNDLLN